MLTPQPNQGGRASTLQASDCIESKAPQSHYPFARFEDLLLESCARRVLNSEQKLIAVGPSGVPNEIPLIAMMQVLNTYMMNKVMTSF